MNKNFKPKTLAYYLPAFHEIPENNEWYGEGFTEWDNTRKGLPNYHNHNQPRVPYNNHYYDLSNIDEIKWQTKIAKQYGVDGFCFYHYWFGGRKILEKPSEILLKTKEINTNFCFAWANEPWRKTWNDKIGDAELLIDQNYGDEYEWKNHYDYLSTFFKDKRYIKINNQPVLLIYRLASIPDAEKMISYFNSLAIVDGFKGIYIVRMNIDSNSSIVDKVDAEVDFEPSVTSGNLTLRPFQSSFAFWKIKRKIFYKFICFDWFVKIFNDTIDYKAYNNSLLKKKIRNTQFYSLVCDWDNTPRKGRRGWSMKNVSVEQFKKTYEFCYTKSIEEKKELIFIFAWNEWGEGGYLEPDTSRKYGFLEAIKSVKLSFK